MYIHSLFGLAQSLLTTFLCNCDHLTRPHHLLQLSNLRLLDSRLAYPILTNLISTQVPIPAPLAYSTNTLLIIKYLSYPHSSNSKTTALQIAFRQFPRKTRTLSIVSRRSCCRRNSIMKSPSSMYPMLH